MKTYRINVTDEPDVIFKGKELASVSYEDVGDLHKITLYQSEKGKYIVVREETMFLSPYPRPWRITCRTCNTLPPFRKFLGNDKCAKLFYKKIGLYNAVRIP